MAARTLYDKLVDAHVIRNLDESGLVLLYVDRTVLNEYTSPQAFAGLRAAGRKVWNPGAALMVVQPEPAPLHADSVHPRVLDAAYSDVPPTAVT